MKNQRNSDELDYFPKKRTQGRVNISDTFEQ
jgi:hypothetical protein